MSLISKLLSLLCLICVIPGNIAAQNEVHLSLGYRPGHSYDMKSDQVTKIDLKLPSEKKSGKQADPAVPTKKIITAHSEIVAITGKIYNDSLFPIKTLIQKIEGADGQSSAVPAGTTVYGTASTGGTVSFDSVVADGMERKTKATFLKTMKSLISQVNVPEHTVKVGDKFTQQTPVAMPIAGINLNMMITTTYKLKSISGGLAYFDITQVLTMKGDAEALSATFKAGGTGKGNMTYDISNSYFNQYELNYVMNMEMKMEGQTMTMKMENNSIQNVVITAN